MIALGKWRLFWWYERPADTAELIPWNASMARLWLPGAWKRSDRLPVLRRLVAQHHPLDTRRWGDEGLLKLVAEGLASRRLLMYEWRPERGGGGTNQEDTPPPLAPAFPLEERRSAGTAPQQAADPDLFPEDAELVAIAGVMTAAAEDGVPFCEECARAAAALRERK